MEKKAIETPAIKLLHHIFPAELMNYFSVNGFYMLCSIETKKEFWLIEFEEKNQLPEGYLAVDYESKGFMEWAPLITQFLKNQFGIAFIWLRCFI